MVAVPVDLTTKARAIKRSRGVVMQYGRQREEMVKKQLKWRGIDDWRVLEAMGKVERERFVAPEFRRLAYADRALPIGEGQTISQPFVVALMTMALEVEPGARVLEVGTGSGYQAAVLYEMGAEVSTIERQGVLAQAAKSRFKELGYGEIEVLVGDGSLGWSEGAPYDGIIVTASGPTIPTPLLEQLKVGGRLVIPVARGAAMQELVRITKRPNGRYRRQELGQVAFVPLIGEEGWSEGGRWV